MALPASTEPAFEPQVLRLATTTSTENTGLLSAILPDFNSKFNAQVEVVAVGTGQALALGRSGDADVVLVHDRLKEDQFMADGEGVERYDVMYNDFIIVGPVEDPAGVEGLSLATDAFAAIARAKTIFVSRGDESGTHARELSIWKILALEPGSDATWYNAIGQGMGATLVFANEKQAYTLSDRGTWLAQKENLPELVVMVGGESVEANLDPALLNPYGVMIVNPEKHPGANFELARQFVEWLTSEEIQQRIADFGRAEYGQPLFYPDSSKWRAVHP